MLSLGLQFNFVQMIMIGKLKISCPGSCIPPTLAALLLLVLVQNSCLFIIVKI